MKLLIISYWFAPSTCANAKRPFCIARGFLDAGWKVDVVCSDHLMPPESGELIQHPRLNLRRLEDPYHKAKKAFSKNCILQMVFMLFSGVLWPDVMILWAFRVGRLVDTSKYDRILVTILPPSLIFLSWIKRVDSRWVFDYQECVSPSRPGHRRTPIYRWFLPLFTLVQRNALSKSGLVIFATRSYREDYLATGLVEEEKTVHIPFFYDSSISHEKCSDNMKLIISYFGVFSAHENQRNPKVFLQALGEFLKKVPAARNVVEFRFYGRWIDKHNKFIKEFGVQDVVHINEAVPYPRYVDLLSEASILLLVVSQLDNMFVPSKMLDYFAARRPILGFVPEDSETYEILKEADMDRYISPEFDVEGGVRCLEALWDSLKKEAPFHSFESVREWSDEVQVSRIIKLLSSK